MTIKELVLHISKYEGKKHEASVADIREIVGILSDLFYNEEAGFDHLTSNALYKNGKRRAKKKGKK